MAHTSTLDSNDLIPMLTHFPLVHGRKASRFPPSFRGCCSARGVDECCWLACTCITLLFGACFVQIHGLSLGALRRMYYVFWFYVIPYFLDCSTYCISCKCMHATRNPKSRTQCGFV
ncbi:hypothetical protein V8E53_004604 [Lactarius tabidus]